MAKIKISRASGHPVDAPSGWETRFNRMWLDMPVEPEVNRWVFKRQWAEETYGPRVLEIECSLEDVIAKYGECIVHPKEDGYEVIIYDDYIE